MFSRLNNKNLSKRKRPPYGHKRIRPKPPLPKPKPMLPQLKPAKADARKARDDYFSNLFHGPKKKIHSDPRELLVKSLGMLGSEHQGERDAAACMAEKQRKKLDMSWDELIIKAAA
jgi:hypothetical protein